MSFKGKRKNYVHFTKEFLQHVSFDGSDSLTGSNYNHLLVYNSGADSDSTVIDTIELVIGRPDG